MSADDLKHVLRQKALDLGFEACHFTTAAPPGSASHFRHWLKADYHGDMAWLARGTEKRANPQLVLPAAKSMIVLASAYPEITAGAATRSTESPKDAPVGFIARYARFKDYHDVLGEKLEGLVKFIHQQSGPGTRALWYVDTGPILERDFGQRAGLGFIGKHTNLVSRRLGNWFFLSEILTTLEFPADQPEKNRCGACTRCLAACPTAAITAPFQLDARRCISYLTIELKGSIPVELRPLIGHRIFGCDDCLAACPWNRFAAAGRMMKVHACPALAAPDLLDLLELTEAGFQRRFAGTPVARSRRRGLLRNVCVALGNAGDERALPALGRTANDAEPLIAEHARWAIAQIKSKAGI
jgi:epoxyqueuosine reductase